jgi:hypothetical protein
VRRARRFLPALAFAPGALKEVARQVLIDVRKK